MTKTWQDTVIDIAEDRYDGLKADTLVEIQAEITFEAGFDEGSKRTLEAADSTFGELLKAERKAGIREVVEWIHQFSSPGYRIDYSLEKKNYIFIEPDLWQAKLKEWQI